MPESSEIIGIFTLGTNRRTDRPQWKFKVYTQSGTTIFVADERPAGAKVPTANGQQWFFCPKAVLYASGDGRIRIMAVDLIRQNLATAEQLKELQTVMARRNGLAQAVPAGR